MRGLVCLIAAFVFFTTGAQAAPIDIMCRTEGYIRTLYGRSLTVHVDEARRYVRIEAPARLPDAQVEYRDGTIGPIFTGKLYPFMTTEIVRQFVMLHRSSIDVGWRDTDGDIVHLGWFNRAALRKNGPPCRWHSAWQFAVS